MATTEMVQVVTDEPRGVAQRQTAGVAALAAMPDQEFDQKLAQLKRGQDRMRRIQRELMEPDEDFGVIPGTNKPTLLKPGAEKLCEVYGLRASFTESTDFGDGERAPHLRVRMKCQLHLGTLDGPVVAEGYGAANSWERKHRYRRGQRACPLCGVIGSVIKGKAEYGGGWLCWKKPGGCGAKFEDNDQRITEQVVGDIENPDPYDGENTLLKMAEKRAFIDAVLRATATSGLFTQDLEDSPNYEPPTRGREAQRDAGEDDAFDLAPEAERIKAAGAEPNPQYAGDKACPKCGTKSAPWKYAKRGKPETHFCKTCGEPFAPAVEAA